MHYRILLNESLPHFLNLEIPKLCTKIWEAFFRLPGDIGLQLLVFQYSSHPS
jgi:hypothetical protein